jgi:hypothetical protein
VESLKARAQNRATVTYYLLLDNKRRLPTNSYLSAELTEVSTAHFQHPQGEGLSGCWGCPRLRAPAPLPLPWHGWRTALLEATLQRCPGAAVP